MEQFILSLGEVSLAAALITAVLLLLTPFLERRYTAKWRYWVFLILALRLVLPFNISLPVRVVEPTFPNREIELALPQRAEDVPEEPLLHTEIEPLSPEAIFDTASGQAAAPQKPAGEDPAPAPVFRLSVLEAAGYLWLLGAVLFAGYEALGYLHFRRGLKRWAAPCTSEHVQACFAARCSAMGLSGKVWLSVCPKLKSPMAAGIFHPVVLLPHENYTEEELTFILTHELVHYRRRDVLYKLLLLAANVVHWFNPLVWLMRREAEKDIEISCDDEVLGFLGPECRARYADTILSCAHRNGRSPALTTGFWSG